MTSEQSSMNCSIPLKTSHLIQSYAVTIGLSVYKIYLCYFHCKMKHWNSFMRSAHR